VSSPSIDDCYAAAHAAGALGGKITGAGGGGYLLLYVPLESQARVRRALRPLGLREMPFTLDSRGVQVLGYHDTRAPEPNVICDHLISTDSILEDSRYARTD
jgi:galactokinase/mevalonate kinase-like predicted kinase